MRTNMAEVAKRDEDIKDAYSKLSTLDPQSEEYARCINTVWNLGSKTMESMPQAVDSFLDRNKNTRDFMHKSSIVAERLKSERITSAMTLENGRQCIYLFNSDKKVLLKDECLDVEEILLGEGLSDETPGFWLLLSYFTKNQHSLQLFFAYRTYRYNTMGARRMNLSARENACSWGPGVDDETSLIDDGDSTF